jgi:hypothetical protein
VAAVHEYGHATRVDESGRTAQVFLGGFNSSHFVARGAPVTPVEAMSIFSGGLEGEQLLADRIGDRMFTAGSATPAELTTLFLTAYGMESYILSTLRESRLASPDRFLNGGRSGRPGDPAQYVMGLTAARLSLTSPFGAGEVSRYFPEIQSNARSIRRRALLNLLDYQYVTMGVGLFRDYMWRGERRVPVRWIEMGSVSIAPGVSYRLCRLDRRLACTAVTRPARLLVTRTCDGAIWWRRTEPRWSAPAASFNRERCAAWKRESRSISGAIPMARCACARRALPRSADGRSTASC